MMIKKTVIAAILLFGLYTMIIKYAGHIWFNTSQSQWQDNIIKAQQYIYDGKDSFENIVVGSSLSCRLITDSLPQTYNLSFSGLSIYDGLDILSHKASIPRNIFIEMNVVLRPEDKNFTSGLFSPVLYFPKKSLRSLRDDKQPIGIAGAVIDDRITEPFGKRVKSFFHLNRANIETETGSDVFSKMVKLQVENYSKVPDNELLDRSFNNLTKYVTNLRRKGSNIIFFEMPVDNALNDLPLANTVRSTFHKLFPDSVYRYIPFPRSVSFETTDGIHLNGQDALKYTIYLRSEMGSYLR